MPSDTTDKGSVFISYRRNSGYLAHFIFDHLTHRGFDVFMDVHDLKAGKFEEVILREVARRDNFVIVLTVGSLDRMGDQKDWLRRELETAQEARRNIIPALDKDVRFDKGPVPKILKRLPKHIHEITTYNAVHVPTDEEYLEAAMRRLRDFLEKSASAPAPPRSPAEAAHVQEAKRMLDFDVPSPADLPKPEGNPAPSWSELQESIFSYRPLSRSGPFSSSLSRAEPSLRITNPRDYLRLNQRSAFAAPDLSIERVTDPRAFAWTLKWTKVPGAVGYVLEIDESPSFTKPFILFEGDRTSYSHNFPLYLVGLVKTRYYRVRAVGPLGQGTWSNVVKNSSLLDP